jgi:hypothetical protein
MDERDLVIQALVRELAHRWMLEMEAHNNSDDPKGMTLYFQSVINEWFDKWNAATGIYLRYNEGEDFISTTPETAEVEVGAA